MEECGPCPVFAGFTLAFALQLRKNARKNLSQGKKNLSQIKKTLSHSTVYILPKHPHITKPSQTHTFQKQTHFLNRINRQNYKNLASTGDLKFGFKPRISRMRVARVRQLVTAVSIHSFTVSFWHMPPVFPKNKKMRGSTEKIIIIISLWKPKLIYILNNDSVRTSQRKRCLYLRKTNR